MTQGQASYSRPGWLLGLLYFGYLLSFADRALFSLALPDLRAANGFSDRELGLLSGLAFAVCYAGVAPIAGWLADRYERRAIFVSAVAVWSIATASTALASGFWSMFAARALVGTGEGALMLLAVSLLSDTRSGGSRDRALGLFISAGAVGNVCALVFGGAMMHHLERARPFVVPGWGALAPWQSIFLIAGAVGILFALVIAVTMQEPARARAAGGAKGAADPTTAAFLRDHRRLLVTLYIGFSVVQMATVSMSVWIVAMLAGQHGWSAGKAGLVFGSTGGVAAIVGAMAFGRVIAAVRRRGFVDAPIVVCVVSAIAFAVFLIGGAATRDATGSLVLLTGAMLVGYGPTIASYVMMGEALPPGARARLAGVNTFSNALISNSLGAVAVGWLSDRVFAGPSGIATSLGLVVGLAVGLGTLIVWSGRASYQHRMAELQSDEGA